MESGSARAGAADELLAVEAARIKSVVEKPLSFIDLTWWREVRPGIYRFETTKPGAPQQLATRAELMKRFGFAE